MGKQRIVLSFSLYIRFIYLATNNIFFLHKKKISIGFDIKPGITVNLCEGWRPHWIDLPIVICLFHKVGNKINKFRAVISYGSILFFRFSDIFSWEYFGVWYGPYISSGFEYTKGNISIIFAGIFNMAFHLDKYIDNNNYYLYIYRYYPYEKKYITYNIKVGFEIRISYIYKNYNNGR